MAKKDKNRKPKKKTDLSTIITRTMPQNLEAERACLACILLDNGLWDEIKAKIDEDSFYHPPHMKIFQAMTKLKNENTAIDMLTLIEQLKKDNALEEAGGRDYLIEISDSQATPANYMYYTKIIRDKAVLRHLIQISTEIITDAYEEDENVIQVLDNAERKVFDISRRRVESTFQKLGDALHNVFDHLDKMQMQTDKKLLGIPTGFSRFDELLSGLQNANFIIVAGRPSMGKTAFALNVSANIALNYRFGVGIFSLEMPIQHLALRLLCSQSRIDSQKAFKGLLSKNEYGKLVEVAGEFVETPIVIDDTPNINLYDLKARARRMKEKYDVKLLLIDYIQLLQTSRTFKTESRQVEISEISRELKALARELNIPLIGISQLSRAVEQREDNRPRLSDLRESGALEQDADVVCFLYRGDYYRKKKQGGHMQEDSTLEDDMVIDDKFGGDELIVRKNRMGPIGTVKLKFLKEYTRFEELALEEE